MQIDEFQAQRLIGRVDDVEGGADVAVVVLDAEVLHQFGDEQPNFRFGQTTANASPRSESERKRRVRMT